ncbi:hypothetical protein GCM10010246_29170 [Streptomyces cuspidosporus]|uniref:Mutator family transposase n=1 Tax=Streptomyces cuspidosporus TaxID=66882 RepID=A0ABP5SZ73_9ACTN
MTSDNVAEHEAVELAAAVSAKAVDDQLIDELVSRAQAEGLQLTGEGGLLQQLTKRLLESALEGEITDHLGYDKHDPAGKDGGNSRNGKRSKTVLTEVGPVEIAVPRDRDGSFEPKIAKKRQKRLTGVDEMVISLAAKGLTTGEVQAHLAEVYGAEVSRQTISTITDKVLEGMAEWQSRPLDLVYPVVFVEAIHVKIRDGAVANRPVYVALAVTVEGRREILGLWAGDGGEGAKHWLHILTEIKNRGVNDVLMLVCDGLKGLPEAVETVWPRTIVQTCVVHRSRTETRCRFRWRVSLTWYGVFGGGARSTRRAVRGVAAASGRAAAASAAGGRGEAAGAWRHPGRRTGCGGERDHGPQGCLRAGSGRGPTACRPNSQAGRGPQAGRGGRSGSAACVDGTGRAG